jgi:predicted DNA-binding transcriptional regulator YafY
MSSDPTSRMLRLLTLLQTHRFWPGSELADRLDVSQRTLRRDIDRLRELGYLVDASRGVAGGYRLQAGTDLPPLLLDDDEAVAIAVGLRTAAGTAVEGIEETSVRALAKLEQVLPKRLRRQVAALNSATVPLTWRRDPVDPETLTTLAQACRDTERVQFGYTRRDGETADRAVEPHQLVAVTGRWYLVAWDTHRADWRTFRLDRVTAAKTCGSRFHKRTLPGGDAAAYVRDSLRQMPRSYEAVLTVFAPAEHVRDRASRLGGTVEECDGDEQCTLTIRSDSLGWLGACIGLLEADYTLHGPPELATWLGEFATRIGRASYSA